MRSRNAAQRRCVQARPGAPGYSLRWQHKGEPPDFELVLIQAEPQLWVNTANLTLLAELRRRAPQAIDWTGMQDVVPLLDAFEATLD